MKIDVHNYAKRLETCLAALVRDDRITETNKQAIRAFCEALTAQGVRLPTLCKYVNRLTVLARLMEKDFAAAGKDDVLALVAKVERLEWADWTKHTTKVCLKRFYQWLRGCDPETYPPEVSWMRLSMGNHSVKLPEELLTVEEVEKLIAAGRNPMEQAFIAVLYDSGCRVGELASLRIKHIAFEKKWAALIVDGKTGMRRVTIVRSSRYLTRWLDAHPLRDQPDAPLWVIDNNKNKDQPLKYVSIKLMLQRAAAKAGIKKRVHPHLFRHSRATFLAGHITEAKLKHHFGWTQSSNMAAVYVHLSGRDIDADLLRLNGIETPEMMKPRTELSVKPCPRCEAENPATARFCGLCTAPLDVRTLMEAEEASRVLASSFAQAAAAGAPVGPVAASPVNLSQADIEQLAKALLPYLRQATGA